MLGDNGPCSVMLDDAEWYLILGHAWLCEVMLGRAWWHWVMLGDAW